MSVWQRAAFVANPGGCPLDQVKSLGLFEAVCVQVAWGTNPVEIDPAWLAQGRSLGFKMLAWAWCDAEDVEGEAEIHAACAQGYDGFSANMEEPYDAHGNSSDSRFRMPSQYLSCLTYAGPLAVTTTPRFASDMTAWQVSGAIHQPQAFSGEIPTATFSAAVDHSRAWGWRDSQIRPLIQCYPTNGVRPDPGALNAEAAAYRMGGIPYVVEQALDQDGRDWLHTVEPTIAAPQPPDEEEEIDVATIIGSQDGIHAAMERLRKLDPGGTKPNRNPNDLSTWGAWDKLERTLQILKDDHDEAAS